MEELYGGVVHTSFLFAFTRYWREEKRMDSEILEEKEVIIIIVTHPAIMAVWVAGDLIDRRREDSAIYSLYGPRSTLRHCLQSQGINI